MHQRVIEPIKDFLKNPLLSRSSSALSVGREKFTIEQLSDWMAEHGDIHVVAKQDPRKSAQRADHRPENSWDFGALRADIVWWKWPVWRLQGTTQWKWGIDGHGRAPKRYFNGLTGQVVSSDVLEVKPTCHEIKSGQMRFCPAFKRLLEVLEKYSYWGSVGVGSWNFAGVFYS